MYRYYATKRAPVSLWMLDDPAPFDEQFGASAPEPEVLAENWITNPAAVSTAQFQAQSGTTAVTGEIVNGAGVISATRTQSGAGDNRLAAISIGSGMPLNPDKKVYAYAMVRTEATRQIKLELSAVNASGGNVSPWPSSSTVFVPANTWTVFEIETTLPAAVAAVNRVQFVGFNFANGEKMEGTNFVLSTKRINYFNGNMPGARWSGQQNNSSSQLITRSPSPTYNRSVPLVAGAEYSSTFSAAAVGQFACNIFKRGTERRPFALEAWALPVPRTSEYSEATKNLVPNPSFETNTNFWSSFGVNAPIRVNKSMDPNMQSKYGAWAMRVFGSNTTSSGDVRPLVGGSGSTLGDLVKGETYTLSAWVYYSKAHTFPSTTDGSRQRRILLWWYYDGNSNTPNASFGPQFPNTAGWHRLTYTFTVPMNATGFQVAIGCAGSTSDTDLVQYIDGVQLEKGSKATTYFDGSSATAVWAGEAHASQSIIAKSGARQQILSHDNEYDGLSIEGNVVRFGTSYANTGDAFCEYDLEETMLAHVVGLHTADANQLYVNGELVASVAITDEQKGDVYKTTLSDLYSGYTDSSQEIAMNGVAIYPTISDDDIKRNYQAGINFIGQDRVIPQYGGLNFDLDAEMNSVFLDTSWRRSSDFELGLKTDVEYSDERILPSYVDGVSVPGNWVAGTPLDAQGDTGLYGVLVSWSGVGITVETSIDGTTWVPQIQNTLVPTITNGFNPTDKDLQIRVSFAGGKADDSAYLDSLTVIGYRNNKVTNPTERPVTVSYPAVIRKDFEPNLYRNDNGILLNGGSFNIGPDSSTEPVVARTVELWVKAMAEDVSLSVDGNTGYHVAGTNLCTNPSAKNNTTGSTLASGSITRLTDIQDAPNGLFTTAYRFTKSNTNTSGFYVDRNPGITLKAGTRYKAFAWVRSSIAGPHLFRIASNTTGMTTTTVDLQPDVWTFVETPEWTPTVDYPGGSVSLITQGGVGNVGSWYDMTMTTLVSEPAVTTAFDGDSPNARWTGTPGNSTSELMAGFRYRNGAVDGSLPVGEWSLVHLASTLDINNIVVSGSCIIGQAALYPTMLPAATVERIWRTYTGSNVVRISEPQTISISESATPTYIYSHPWAIDSAG